MKTDKVKSSWIKNNSIRIDAPFHLSTGRKTRIKMENSPYELDQLENVSEKLFFGNIFRRTFVCNPVKGIPYLTGSDMVKTNINTGKLLSKKLTNKKNSLIIKKDWILLSCSGTIGNVVYTNETFDGKIGTHDLIRIIPNKSKIFSGFLHAFLASKYGYSLLTQTNYGGVVKHIEPKQIYNLPIPIFPKTKQQRIHNLIIEAAKLRVKADKLLEDIENNLYSIIGFKKITNNDYEYYGTHSHERKARTFNIKKSHILDNTIKAFNYSESLRKMVKILTSKIETKPLFEVLNSKGLYHSSAFKRIIVSDNNGVELISQKDIFKFHLKGKNISKIYPKEKDFAKNDEILISGVGSMGEGDAYCRTILVKKNLIGKVIAGEFIRMASDKLPSGYLYAWLSSSFVFRLLRSYTTGTTLCRPIEALIEKIPVPILDSKEMKIIDNKVKLAHDHRYNALLKEKQAINLIENEIDSWQN